MAENVCLISVWDSEQDSIQHYASDIVLLEINRQPKGIISRSL